MKQKKRSTLTTNCFYSKINRTAVIEDPKIHIDLRQFVQGPNAHSGQRLAGRLGSGLSA